MIWRALTNFWIASRITEYECYRNVREYICTHRNENKRMIPKVIHYCWFGGKALSRTARECMSSWKRLCPDYEIIRWDESNCDLGANRFVADAYHAGQWAFVSDYFRLRVVEEHGGVYLDVDVELLKPLDDLLVLDGYMGFELGVSNHINSGLGFGARARHPLIAKLRKNYENISFVMPDGSMDTTPCPERDTRVLTGLGLTLDNRRQVIQGIVFFPSEYFSPIGLLGDGCVTSNSYSRHHFSSSWLTGRQKKGLMRRKKLRQGLGVWLGDGVNLIIQVWDEVAEIGFNGLLKRIAQRRNRSK